MADTPPSMRSGPGRALRHNPFASGPGANPLMLADALTLVPVPDAPVETHEAPKPRRSYLARASGAGGLDLSDLLRGARGRRPVPHERSPEPEPEDDDEPTHAPAARPASGPPRYGMR